MNNIKAILLDVDGVMTDGKKYYFGSHVAKSFSAIDGQGIHLLHKQDIRIGIITADLNWMEIYIRAKELGISKDDVYMTGNKVTAARDFSKKHGIKLKNICFIGDDIPDIPLLKLVGLPACPIDAVGEVHNVVDEYNGYMCDYGGGNGAVRDVIEYILEKTHK